ncbi:hypothetical protein [Shewanella marina]|uniref:hypothetical protein n=1 Tax=Shewanella marina TaxID=487319 RepID=UPI00046F8A11|nr:hypothetical protein [Shewanella marina]
MLKILPLALLLFVSGCISTPASISFKGKTVNTYSVAASCKDMQLDTDCSAITGATKDISIDNIPLRIASGENGKVIFVMAASIFGTDESTLTQGASAIEKLLISKGIVITAIKVMYGGNDVYGVHYQLNSDGYSILSKLSI